MIVPYAHVLVLSAVLFMIGMVCLVTRKNLIMMLLGLEIMLNASALAFIGTGLLFKQLEGQAMALFILALAAAEVSLGLALIVCIYRQTSTVNPECIEKDECILE
jgi:NADH-quinone oxidoreductase subunit K